MNGTLATYGFLPWLRRGVATEIERVDGAGPSAPRATFPVTLAFNQATPDERITARLELHGPGEIAGIDRRMIVRTDPSPGAASVESNYFPLVEFDEPDFPWRYTPAAATAGDRLRPWVVLIVLTDAEIETATPAGPEGRLPTVTVREAASLPNLAQSWAWAHVQVAGLGRATVAAGTVAAEIARILTREPERAVSRVLCARRLEPRMPYTACLVPAFERGRRAGLGETIDADRANPLDALAPAWSTGDTAVRLPVYHQWRFHTGEAGDFESLVRQLLPPRALPATVGRRDMDVANPGGGLPAATAGGTLPLEGALRSAASRASVPEWNDRVAFVNALRDLVNRPDDLLVAGGVPEAIAPPLYGRWHAARRRLAPGTAPSWFDETNSDPRHRAVAGLGARVVQEQQHQLMAGAWDQVEGVLAANKKLREAQLGCAVAARLIERDFIGLEPATTVQISAPILARILASPRTIRAVLDDSRVAVGSLDPSFRRATRPLGPVGRRAARVAGRSGRFGVRAATSALRRMNAGELPLAPFRPRGTLATLASIGARLAPVSEDRPPEDAAPWLVALAIGLLLLAPIVGSVLTAVILTALAAVAGAAAWRAARAMQRRRDRRALLTALRDGSLTADAVRNVSPVPEFAPVERGRDGAPIAQATAVANFQQAAAALASRLPISREQDVPRPGVDLATLGTKILEAVRPERTIADSLQRRLSLPPGIARRLGDSGPVLASPEFAEPMYEPLRDLSQEWLLPGVGEIPPNTISLLETNQRFVESYMLGLNHAMARELLWHEYPTDQRGTYFRQFWDVRGYAGPSGADLHDVEVIHDWPAASALGTHRPGTPPPDSQLVLLIRGEVWRRYPGTVVYAVRAVLEGAVPVASGGRRTLGIEERFPLFQGTLDPDITFVGFDLGQAEARGDDASAAAGDQGWFFVLQEQPAGPRFGLDVPTQVPGAPLADWNALSWAHLVRNAGELASLTYIDLDPPTPEPSAPQLPLTPPAPANEPQLAWHARRGARSSDIAYITIQPPYRVAIHGSDMLPAENA